MEEFLSEADKILKNFNPKMRKDDSIVDKNKVQYKEYKDNTIISAYNNLLLSFQEVEEIINNMQENVSDIRLFKRLVLNIDNSVELLFKILIANREEILLYSDEDFKKVLEKYREANKNGFSSLEDYFMSGISRNNLHTISFSKACDILEAYYRLVTPKFAQKCKKMAEIRNGLTHYSTIVQYVDIITVLNVYKEAYELFVEEYDTKYDIQMILEERKRPEPLEFDIYYKILNICQNEIYTRLIDNDILLHIVGFIVEERGGLVLDQKPDDIEKIERLFFSKYAKYYEKKDINNWHKEFEYIYSIMLDADIVSLDRESYEFFYSIKIDDKFLEIIARKYSEEEQKTE